MFNFFDMADDYTERAINRYEVGELIVDTCAVTDSANPYETAVSHPAYYNGNWIVVEMYDTKADAKAGHDRWVATMTAETLPSELCDVNTSGVGAILGAIPPYAYTP